MKTTRSRSRRTVMFESLESRLQLSAGNILVSNTNGMAQNNVFEYNQAGTRVRTRAFSTSDQIRDIVVDGNGRIHAFNGTFTPSLTSVRNGNTTENTFAGWSITNTTDFGGIASYKNFVYVTDQVIANEQPTDQGVVRFDTSNGYAATRFVDTLDTCDLSLGMDGKLYVLSGNSSSTAGLISILDPITMNVLNTVTPPGIDNRAVGADTQGNIYVGSFNGTLTKIDSNGNVLMTIQTGADDIDVSSDNFILARTGTTATIYDTSLNVVKTIGIPVAQSGAAFVAWATNQVPPAPADISGHIYNDRDDSSDQSVNDRPLSGVHVFADINGNGVLDNGEPNAVTNGKGLFTMASSPVGTYKIRQVVPAGFRQSAPTKRTYINVTVAGIDQTDLLFLNTQKSEISGVVFNDRNASGIFDSNDRAFLNMVVFLDANNNGIFDVGENSTLADPANGSFTFRNVSPGSVVIRATRPRGFTQTAPNTGFFTVTLGAAQLLTDRNFGYRQR